MAGFIIGGMLLILGCVGRHTGHEMIGDVEFAIGALCMSIQYGVNAIIEALRK